MKRVKTLSGHHNIFKSREEMQRALGLVWVSFYALANGYLVSRDLADKMFAIRERWTGSGRNGITINAAQARKQAEKELGEVCNHGKFNYILNDKDRRKMWKFAAKHAA